MASSLADEVFHEVAYKAKNKKQIIAGLDEFLDQVTVLPPGEWDRSIRIRVAMKIFEDFGGALNKAFIRGWEPVSIIHYTRPGTCINRPLH